MRLIPRHRDDLACVDLEKMFAGRSDVYCLRVRGGGYRYECIIDGDTLVVERTNTAEPNALIVSTCDGFTSLYRHRGRVAVEGVVIGVLRSFRGAA